MTTEDDIVIQFMFLRGGSFVRAIAYALQVADRENFAKIKATWPEYWQTYSVLAHKETQQ